MDALSESYRQYAKPRRSAVTRVSGEHGGWRLTAGAYLLVPFTRATRSAFPRDWTILLTFRPAAAYQVHNTKQVFDNVQKLLLHSTTSSVDFLLQLAVCTMTLIHIVLTSLLQD